MSTQVHDIDPIETQEWLDALSSVLETEGEEGDMVFVQGHSAPGI